MYMYIYLCISVYLYMYVYIDIYIDLGFHKKYFFPCSHSPQMWACWRLWLCSTYFPIPEPRQKDQPSPDLPVSPAEGRHERRSFTRKGLWGLDVACVPPAHIPLAKASPMTSLPSRGWEEARVAWRGQDVACPWRGGNNRF